MTVGVGWGRTLYNTLPFIVGQTLADFRVVSLLGGIAAARRFNPAEFAWQFAELFQGEGFLIPAPAVVDSPETKHALLERCGLAAIFEMADKLDMAVISVGGISTLTTSYRTGYLSEADRRSLVEAGAVGDVLYNFIGEDGALVDHEVNARAIAVSLDRVAAHAGARADLRRQGQARGASRLDPQPEAHDADHGRAIGPLARRTLGLTRPGSGQSRARYWKSCAKLEPN